MIGIINDKTDNTIKIKKLLKRKQLKTLGNTYLTFQSVGLEDKLK